MRTVGTSCGRILGWLAVCLLSAGILSAGEGIFSSVPDLVGLIRIGDVDRSDARLQKLFLQLNPHREERYPLRRWLGAMLRNPDLQDLPRDATTEFFFLLKEREEAIHWMAAFDVVSASSYKATLLKQQTIREVDSNSEIGAFGEQTPTGMRMFYMFSLSDKRVLIGDNMEILRDHYMAVARHASRIRPAEAGDEDVVLQCHWSRYYARRKTALRRSFGSLRKDILDDVLKGVDTHSHPFSLLLEGVEAEVIEMLGQPELLQAALRIGADSLEARFAVAAGRDASLTRMLERAPRRALALDRFLPDNTVRRRQILLWPEAWRERLQTASRLGLSSLQGGLGADAETEGTLLLSLLGKADPQEIADALVPYPEQKGAVLLKLIGWGDAARAAAFQEALMQVAADGALKEYLSGKGILLRLQCEKAYRRIGLTPVDRIELEVRANLPGLADAPLKRRFLMASPEGTTVLAAGLGDTEESLCLKAMKEVLARMSLSVDEPKTPAVMSEAEKELAREGELFDKAVDRAETVLKTDEEADAASSDAKTDDAVPAAETPVSATAPAVAAVPELPETGPVPVWRSRMDLPAYFDLAFRSADVPTAGGPPETMNSRGVEMQLSVDEAMLHGRVVVPVADLILIGRRYLDISPALSEGGGAGRPTGKTVQ